VGKESVLAIIRSYTQQITTTPLRLLILMAEGQCKEDKGIEK